MKMRYLGLSIGLAVASVSAIASTESYIIHSPIEFSGESIYFQTSKGEKGYYVVTSPYEKVKPIVDAEVGDCFVIKANENIEGIESAKRCKRSTIFQKYPAKVYKGKHRYSASGDFADFPTRLKQTSKEKIGFAGKYVLGGWGCGAGCFSNIYLDVQSGKARAIDLDINPDVDCANTYKAGLYTKPNSKLLIAIGWQSDDYYMGDMVECSVSHYIEKNGQLVKLR